MTASRSIRILETPADLLAARDAFLTAMVGLRVSHLTAETIVRAREPGRTYGAYDGEQLVGTTDSTSGSLVLPGGTPVPHAAVTRVGVLPTHTRQGVISALLRGQLRDCRERGDVVATLRASEAVIYGRFGYGVASSAVSATVTTARATPRDRVTGAVELGAATIDTQERTVADNPSTRPGAISRSSCWWEADRLRATNDDVPVWLASSTAGYARYRPQNPGAWWSGDDRSVVIEDLHAPTDAVFADLVHFLLRLDLVDRLVFETLPVDTVLPLLVQDRRAVRIGGTADETWLRILDVREALARRSYAGAGEIVVTVRDADLPENAGTYRIGANGVESTSVPAQLTVDVRELATVLLGGTRWSQLAAAGMVEVADTHAIAVADALFATDRAPHAGVDF